MEQYLKTDKIEFHKLIQSACFWLLILIIPSIGFSQISKQDSLQTILNQNNLDPGEKVMTQGRLAVHYYFNDNQRAADSLINEAIELGSTLPDKQYLARTLAIQAMQLKIQGDHEGSQKAITRSLKSVEKTESFSVKGYVWYAKGWLEIRDSDSDHAVESFLMALKYYDAKTDPLDETDKSIKAAIYQELYSIYGRWNDHLNMEKYARISLEHARQSKSKDALSSSLYSLGFSFEQQYRSQPDNKVLLDSAQFFYKESIATILQYPEQITSRNQLPFNAVGLANLYSEFYPISYKDSAQVYLDMALDEGLKTKQYGAVASAYGIMNEYAQKENNWDDAEKYLLLSADYSEKQDLPATETLFHIKLALSKVYEKKGDYKSALQAYKEYIELYESRFDAERMAVGKELEVKYESELKEQKLQLLQEQAAHRKTLNIIYVILALISLVALFFLWMAYRQRIKAFDNQVRLHHIELERIRQEHKISLLSAMIEGQEKERARIARDLHDSLGGLLSSIKIMLSSGKDKNLDSEHSLRQEVIQRIDYAVDELRRISHNMMPEVLMKFGLIEALREYCHSLKRSGVNITFQAYNYQNTLEDNKQMVVYRVAQELVNNAMKYAEANHILLEIREQEECLSLLVEDDGKGFDFKKIRKTRGSGLNNIQARAVYLNGDIQVDSTIGVGTTFTLNCPVGN